MTLLDLSWLLQMTYHLELNLANLCSIWLNLIQIWSEHFSTVKFCHQFSSLYHVFIILLWLKVDDFTYFYSSDNLYEELIANL